MARCINFASSPRGKSQGSLAEAAVNALLSELPDDYTVMTGITVLNDDARRALTELDTVVITPLGAVCVLEVKSGSLEVDESAGLFRHYQGGEGDKNISEQLARQSSILVRRMKQFGSPVHFAHFLVLPNGVLSDGAAAVLNHLEGRVFDSKSVARLPQRIVEFNAEAGCLGRISDARALESFFASHYTYKPDAAAICDAIALARKNTRAGLAAWVPRIRTKLPFVVVEAPAGAGKTVLAQNLLKLAAADGRKAVYLTFARNIAERMLEAGAGIKASFLGTWHELACECEGPGKDISTLNAQELSEYFDYCSEVLMRALNAHRYAWDVIIVDDAQSFKPEWVQALAQALTATGRMYVLSDPYARVFDGRDEIEFDEDQTIFVHSDETLRVPQCQAEELRAFGLVSPQFESTCSFAGDHTFIAERYTGPDTLYKATKRTLEEFVTRGFRPDQIFVLSWRGRSGSDILSRQMLGAHHLRKPLEKFDANNLRVFTEGDIYCDTLRRACGLSAPCVIVTEMDFDEVGPREKAMLYLAMTRAEAALAFVMSERGYRALIEYLESI